MVKRHFFFFLLIALLFCYIYTMHMKKTALKYFDEYFSSGFVSIATLVLFIICTIYVFRSISRIRIPFIKLYIASFIGIILLTLLNSITSPLNSGILLL